MADKTSIPAQTGDPADDSVAVGPAPAEIAALVARGNEIKAQTKVLNLELAEIAAKLVKAGAGEHSNPGGARCTVVQPKPKIEPDASAIEEVRELVGEDVFKKLFTRTVTFVAHKAVRHVAAALLTPGKLKKFFELCETPVAGYVIWPK